MNNLAEVCLMGLEVGGNSAKCLVILYHLYLSVTLQALSETIPPIWINVNIDYFPACQILFCV